MNRTKRIVAAVGAFNVTAGVLALIGWGFGINALKGVFPGLSAMKPNTAFGLILGGVALWLLHENGQGKRRRQLGQAAALLVVVIGAVTLTEYGSGLDLRIDEALFADDVPALHPGRMGVNTALSFCLLGLSFLLLDSGAKGGRRLVPGLALAAGTIAFASVAGYLLRISVSHTMFSSTGMAVHTSVALLLLSAGSLVSQSDAPLLKMWTSDTAGGWVVRRLLPATILIFVVLGGVMLAGIGAGWYDIAFGAGLLVIAGVVSFGALIWWNAVRLDRAEIGRRAAEHERGEAVVLLRDQAEMLRISEERRRLASQAANIGTFEWSIRTNELFWSPEQESLYGLPPGGFRQGYEHWRKAIHPEDRDRAEAAVLRAVLECSDLNVEFRIVRPGGELRWIAARARVFTGSDSAALRMIGVNQDITDRKRAERERDRLIERERVLRREAEQASRLKDEFVATISHELRTPLTAVIGWTELLLAGNLEPDRERKALETIYRSACSQASMIEELLDLSAIMSGRLQLELKPRRLQDLVTQVVDLMRPAAASKRIRLMLDVDPSVPRVPYDDNRMRQAFWNLLSNAIKFTSQNGSITVRLVTVEGFAQIQVTDTGVGIEPEFLPFVFDRFRQEDSSTTRKYGGLGIGLAVTKHLIEQHGGTVSVYSLGPGKGATFILSLPISRSASVPDTTIAPVVANVSISELHDIRVLVVVDDLNTCDLLSSVFKRCGAEVQTALSSREGLEGVMRWQPQILIADTGMPGEDAYSLIRKVRTLAPSRGGNMPAIALTAYASEEDRMRALKAGFQLHMTKPFNANDLVHAAMKLLRSPRAKSAFAE